MDMIMATRLNGPYTVYSHLFKSREVYEHAKQFPDGFPVPGSNPMIENKDTRGLAFQTLWRNLNIFHRQVSYEGYNPLHLKGFEELADNHPGLFETILQNPLVYFSDLSSPLDSLPVHEQDSNYLQRRVYFNDEEYDFLKKEDLMLNPGDTLFIRDFSPVEVQVVTSTGEKAMLNMLQNNYYGWKAKLDGEEAKIYTGNMSFITVIVPSGEHEVRFYYDPVWVKAGFWISISSLVLGLVILGTLGVFDNGYPKGAC
jgi:hypothetical protein